MMQTASWPKSTSSPLPVVPFILKVEDSQRRRSTSAMRHRPKITPRQRRGEVRRALGKYRFFFQSLATKLNKSSKKSTVALHHHGSTASLNLSAGLLLSTLPTDLSLRQHSEDHFPAEAEIIESRSKSCRVVLNVGGDRHEVLWRTLDRLPKSRLGRLRQATTHQKIMSLCDDYSLKENEYFFDRHPQSFGCVLNMYRTGHLHTLDDICILAYHSDLVYWGIEDHHMNPCCLGRYYQKKEHVEDEMKKVNEIFMQQMDEEYFGNDRCAVYRKQLWDILEKPQTSTAARVS